VVEQPQETIYIGGQNGLDADGKVVGAPPSGSRPAMEGLLHVPGGTTATSALLNRSASFRASETAWSLKQLSSREEAPC
jgi:hypothetical protein